MLSPEVTLFRAEKSKDVKFGITFSTCDMSCEKNLRNSEVLFRASFKKIKIIKFNPVTDPYLILPNNKCGRPSKFLHFDLVVVQQTMKQCNTSDIIVHLVL